MILLSVYVLVGVLSSRLLEVTASRCGRRRLTDSQPGLSFSWHSHEVLNSDLNSESHSLCGLTRCLEALCSCQVCVRVWCASLCL
ncbi:hypothetical protein V1519DRAFT_441780 [Lipomyces tetrasporus]